MAVMVLTICGRLAYACFLCALFSGYVVMPQRDPEPSFPVLQGITSLSTDTAQGLAFQPDKGIVCGHFEGSRAWQWYLEFLLRRPGRAVIMAIRSARKIASSTSCVTNSMVVPPRARGAATVPASSARLRFEGRKGLVHKHDPGLVDEHPGKPTRCCMPPEAAQDRPAQNRLAHQMEEGADLLLPFV